jgi:hypothetical protein
MKKIHPMKAANSCRDGIQNRIICQLKFANAEIPWTSVERRSEYALIVRGLGRAGGKAPDAQSKYGPRRRKARHPRQMSMVDPPQEPASSLVGIML